MKFALVAVAAAMVAGASASQHKQHDTFHKRGAFAHVAHNVTDIYTNQPPPANGTEECGCYTTWVTTYGEATLAPRPPKAKPTTAVAPAPSAPAAPVLEVKPTTSEAPAPVETQTIPVVPQPTAEVSVFPTPGTYTIPATTITATQETTVADATTISVPAGTHTFGGVTTVVEGPTTVTAPYATIQTTNGVVTSTILETTYVCPTAGTYTIAPITSVAEQSTVFVYPTPHVVAPGTYTRPEEIVTVTVPNYVYVCPAPVTDVPAPVAPVATATAPVLVPEPTAEVSIFPTPGTYTIPATTVTVTEETTVAEATTTSVPAGTHTFGGVTTVVNSPTTVTAPYATVETTNGVVTSIIRETTYVCPTAGTYTIAPITSVAEESTVFVYPTPHAVAPGTYTRPEEIVTVTVPNYVYICPAPVTEEAPAPTVASSTPAPVVETPKPVVTAPAPVAESPKPVVTAPAPVVEASSSVVVIPAATTTAPASSKAPVKTSTSTPSLGDDTDHWAITYTPYTSDGLCKGTSEVLSDITKIAQKGFSTIRVYSADKNDCNGLDNITAACVANGLNIVIGVYVSDTGLAAAQPQIEQLVTYKHWDRVSLVVIGNEAIFGGFCTASELVTFIYTAKERLRNAGYTGPVTTAEPINILQEYATLLCDVVDVVGSNIHPYFNSGVTAEKAGEFAKSELDIVEALCPGKTGINLEIGWPSAGNCNGAACPGTSEQRTAMAAIREKLGGKSVFFSFDNDLWKEPGEFGCEQYWGVGDIF